MTSATVHKKGIAAALLEKQGSEIRFSYLDEYLKSDLPPIATTLPKSPEVLSFSRGATPSYFTGLLPEGRRLSAIANRMKTSVDDELSLLIEIGNDLIGDVQVIDPTKPSPRKPVEISLSPSELDFKNLRGEIFGSAATGIPGVQDKVSSSMLNAPVKTKHRQFLLKLNPSEHPYVVENEHYFLTLAKKAGLKVSNFRLLTDAHGEKALMIERFDRPTTSPAGWLAVEDSCQLLDHYPADKYNLTVEQISQALVNRCSAKSVAVLDLIQQLAFSYLIGNGDAHAKNFSVLESQSAEYRISPAYDLLSTMFYKDRTMALTLDGKDAGWRQKDLIALAITLGLSEKAAVKAISQIVTKTDIVTSDDFGSELPFHNSLRFDVSKRLRKRWRAFSDSEN